MVLQGWQSLEGVPHLLQISWKLMVPKQATLITLATRRIFLVETGLEITGDKTTLREVPGLLLKALG